MSSVEIQRPGTHMGRRNAKSDFMINRTNRKLKSVTPSVANVGGMFSATMDNKK